VLDNITWTLVLGTALIDSAIPCTIGVILILSSVLLRVSSRKILSRLGGTYIVTVYMLSGLLSIIVFPNSTTADEIPCCPSPIYEAPEYVAPPKLPAPKSHLQNNGDGTLTNPDTGMMWAQKDSYADLDKCLTYTESLKYVENLKTGGYDDWRIPTLKELASIYDETQQNVMAWDHDPEYPLALDSKFADGAAYWYWSIDCGTTELTQHCAKTLYFVNGIIEMRRFELCNNGGVRAVRNTP
jgi:uncharacterized protein DUF1566